MADLRTMKAKNKLLQKRLKIDEAQELINYMENWQ